MPLNIFRKPLIMVAYDHVDVHSSQTCMRFAGSFKTIGKDAELMTAHSEWTDTAVENIDPLPANIGRCDVSVMMPVYDPSDYFVAALRDVLNQDLGADKMQIVVCDDASPRVDVKSLIERAGGAQRVAFIRHPKNLGLAGNWNACIRAARGNIVHILHQDDRIEPGFYSRVLPAFNRSERIGMSFTRHTYIDEHDRITHRSHRERWFAGILKGWDRAIAERQRIQCASVMVKRAVYETVGGFRSDLCYALDWEMWTRIAFNFEVWYEPKILAAYRQHSGNETRRLDDLGRASEDTLRAIEVVVQNLPDAYREELTNAAYAHFARRALKRCEKMLNKPACSALLVTHIKTAVSRMNSASKTRREYETRADQLAKRWSD